MSQVPALTLDLSRSDDGDPGIAPPSADRPLTAAEQQQVDQAVATVNAILLGKNLEIAIELHRYVLAEFFGGSWQAWADNRPGGNSRALAQPWPEVRAAAASLKELAAERAPATFLAVADRVCGRIQFR